MPLIVFSALPFKLPGRGTGACDEKISSKLFWGGGCEPSGALGKSINNDESPFLAAAVFGTVFEEPLSVLKKLSAPPEDFRLPFAGPGIVPIVVVPRFVLAASLAGAAVFVPFAAAVLVGAPLVGNVGVLEMVGVDLVPSGALGCVLACCLVVCCFVVCCLVVCCLVLVVVAVLPDEGPMPGIAFLPLAGAGVWLRVVSAGILPMITVPRFGCGASRVTVREGDCGDTSDRGSLGDSPDFFRPMMLANKSSVTWRPFDEPFDCVLGVLVFVEGMEMSLKVGAVGKSQSSMAGCTMELTAGIGVI